MISTTRLGELFSEDPGVQIILFSVRSVFFPILFNKWIRDENLIFEANGRWNVVLVSLLPPKIFWGKVGEFIWGPRFWFSFFVTQQVTKRKYNSSRCLSGCHRCPFRCLYCLLQQKKIYVPSTLLKNCLTFYLAKYIVDISALQHYCLPQL